FLFMPKDYSMGPFFATIDTAVMGRKTYDVALKMGGGSYGGSGMKSYVFSHSQPPGERGGVTFVNDSSKSFIEKLRKRSGKNIWLMGGGELARSFLKEDLVDELYIGIVPVLVGDQIFLDRKSTRLNSSHLGISYAVFCLKKKKKNTKSKQNKTTNNE